MAEIVVPLASADNRPVVGFEGLIPDAASGLTAAEQEALTRRFGPEQGLNEAERAALVARFGAQGTHPQNEAIEAEGRETGGPLAAHESVFLHQVEVEVSRRVQQLPWWQRPFAEQIKPFLRAKAKEELRSHAAGALSASSFAAEAAQMVGDESRQDEVASSCERVAQPNRPEAPSLRESSGKVAVAKAVLHEYVQKGSAVTSLAAAGLMFVPGGQLIGSAAIAVHGAVKLRTTVHDAGVRAQEHVAQAQIRVQATGSAGEDMGALARIKQNLVHAHQLPASTIKEVGLKVLAYAGAVISPLGEEHQVARAAARGFSRMLAADEILAGQEDVLQHADVPTLVALSERIGQSLARGFVRNVQRTEELQAYKQKIDDRVNRRAGHAYEALAARNEQSEAIAAELDELARADAKWAAHHQLKYKLTYGALASTAAVRMAVAAMVAAEGLASLTGADLPGLSVHAAASHVANVSTAHVDLHPQAPNQPHIVNIPTKDAPLVDRGVLPGHGQGFAVDTTPDGKSVEFYSLDGSGNAIEIQSGGHTYIIPFSHGRLVLGHNGTVNAVTNDGSIVQLKQDDVLKYLGIDQQVQHGLQTNGGVLDASGYQLAHKVTEVQYDSHTGVYHELASTTGDQGGTLEAHTDVLPVQHTESVDTHHGGGATGQPTPTPTPKPSPTPTQTPTPSPTPGPTKTPTPSPTAVAPSPTATPNTTSVPAGTNHEGVPGWFLPLGLGLGAFALGTMGVVVAREVRRNRNQPQPATQPVQQPPLTPLPLTPPTPLPLQEESPVLSQRPSLSRVRTQRLVQPGSTLPNPAQRPAVAPFVPAAPAPLPAQVEFPVVSPLGTSSNGAPIVPVTPQVRPFSAQPVSAAVIPPSIPPRYSAQNPSTQTSGSMSRLHSNRLEKIKVPLSPDAAEIVQLGIPAKFDMRNAKAKDASGQMRAFEVDATTFPPEVMDEVETPYYSIGWSSDEGDRLRGKPDEDTVKVVTARGVTLAIVADGMGGHAYGKEASEAVANKIEEEFQRLIQAEPEANLTKQWAAQMLAQAAKIANSALYSTNQENIAKGLMTEEKKSGSTVTIAAVLPDGSYAVANVGDSRTYRVGGTAASRITTDHSVVESLAEAGVIPHRVDVYTHPKRSQIYRSMGRHPDVEVDTFVSADGEELAEGEELALCCDGIWEMVREPDGSVTNARQFHRIVRSTNSPMEAARRLVIAAIYGDGQSYGGDDNASALVIRRKPTPVAA